MRFEQEQSVKAFVEKAGFRATLLGVAVWVSEIIYCIVLAAIYYSQPVSNEPQTSESTIEFLSPLTAILGFVAFFIIPLFIFAGMRWVEKIIEIRRTSSKWIVKSAVDFPGQFQMLNAKYLQFALMRTAIAEAPGVFGLQILLIQMFGGSGVFHPEWVTYAAISMMVWAMILKASVIPTAGRLERYMIEKLSNEPEDRKSVV